MEAAETNTDPTERWPWYVTVGFALIMALSAGFLSLVVDPEARYWRAVARERSHDLGAIRESNAEGPTIFVGGGSSCSFSVHPDVLEEVTGLPAVNVGGSAAMGYRYLAWLATKDAREGDVVILHLEPDIVRGREKWGSSLAAKVDAPRWTESDRKGAFARNAFENPWTDRLSSLKPGAKFLGTLSMKILSGRDLYRYKVEDILPRGVVTTRNREPNADIEPFAPMAHWLDEEAMADLDYLADYARERKILLFFTLPWEAFREEAIKRQRVEHAAYLRKVSEALPVLVDEKMGAVSDNSMFLDTGFHLTLEAGRMRTKELGEALKRALEKEL